MMILFYLRDHRSFYGQLFLTYLILYAAGRFVLEYFRGDAARGFLIENYISHSQFIAISVFAIISRVYVSWSRRNRVVLEKKRV